MKICIIAWVLVGIEDQIGIGPGSNHNEGPKLGIGPGSIFRAGDWPGIEILGLDPSLVRRVYSSVFMKKYVTVKVKKCKVHVFYIRTQTTWQGREIQRSKSWGVSLQFTWYMAKLPDFYGESLKSDKLNVGRGIGGRK